MTGSVRYCIKHTSRYVYSSPVSKSAMTLCHKLQEDGKEGAETMTSAKHLGGHYEITSVCCE